MTSDEQTSQLGFTILRASSIDPGLPMHTLGATGVDALDGIWVLFEHGVPRWQVGVDWGVYGSLPFREEVIWESAGVVVIGGGDAVYFVDLISGELRQRLHVPCRFGHLALDAGEPGVREESLYVLGWTDAIAVAPTLQVRWWQRDVAVDGVCFSEAAGAILRLSVEMDPPGGWFEIELEAATGREIARSPAFTDGYVGIYGSAKR